MAVFLSVIFLWGAGSAQELVLRRGFLSQVVFPSEILEFHPGFDPKDFSIVFSHSILYIELLSEMELKSNFFVKTAGGHFLVRVSSGETPMLSLGLSEEDALWLSPEKKVPTLEEAPQVDLQAEAEEERLLSVAATIEGENIGVREQSLELVLKGLYVHGQKLCLRLIIYNFSHAPYSISAATVASCIRTRSRKSSVERLDIPVLSLKAQHDPVSREGSEVLVWVPLFSFSKGRELRVDLVEKNGTRHIGFSLSDSQYLRLVRTL